MLSWSQQPLLQFQRAFNLEKSTLKPTPYHECLTLAPASVTHLGMCAPSFPAGFVLYRAEGTRKEAKGRPRREAGARRRKSDPAPLFFLSFLLPPVGQTRSSSSFFTLPQCICVFTRVFCFMWSSICRRDDSSIETRTGTCTTSEYEDIHNWRRNPQRTQGSSFEARTPCVGY